MPSINKSMIKSLQPRRLSLQHQDRNIWTELVGPEWGPQPYLKTHSLVPPPFMTLFNL
jgi:hypothetical protein